MISKRSDEAEAPARVAEAVGAGQKPRTKRGGAQLGAATSGRTKSEDHQLMEQVVERSNLKLAYQRVVENKGPRTSMTFGHLSLKTGLRCTGRA
jgi:RNA-directed DNA polymerase